MAPATAAPDRLTGLNGRAHFTRAVDQVDRDRDRMIVAVIAIDGLAEVNQLCGHDAGDRLLQLVGRALGRRASVDVVVGRVDGGRLGLLVAPAPNRQPIPAVEPVLEDLTAAIDDWAAEQTALGTPPPIDPVARAGTAVGYGSAILADAETALDAALGDPIGATLVVADADHPGLADHRRRRRSTEELAALLHRGGPVIGLDPIEALAPPARPWVRLRADATPVRADDPEPFGRRDLGISPGLAARLDRRVVERAADLATEVIAPFVGPLLGARSVLTDPPSTEVGIVVEADAADLVAAVQRAGGSLGRRLAELGWSVAIRHFDGGWPVWRLVEHLPIHHLRPGPDLVSAAIGDAAIDPVAGRVATDLLAHAHDRGIPVVASGRPAVDLDPVRLAAWGFTHVDRGPAPIDRHR